MKTIERFQNVIITMILDINSKLFPAKEGRHEGGKAERDRFEGGHGRAKVDAALQGSDGDTAHATLIGIGHDHAIEVLGTGY